MVVSQNTAGQIRSRCRRGDGGSGNRVRRQASLLGVGAFGFSLRGSQLDPNFSGKIIYLTVVRTVRRQIILDTERKK
jgi:hypothetical protein